MPTATSEAFNIQCVAPAVGLPTWVQQTNLNEWCEVPGGFVGTLTYPNYIGHPTSKSTMESGTGLRDDDVKVELYYHGGGHTENPGNEVVAFRLDLEVPTWRTIIPPSTPPFPIDGVSHFASDGKPMVGHTARGNHWWENGKKFVIFGHGPMWKSSANQDIHMVDPEASPPSWLPDLYQRYQETKTTTGILYTYQWSALFDQGRNMIMGVGMNGNSNELCVHYYLNNPTAAPVKGFGGWNNSTYPITSRAAIRGCSFHDTKRDRYVMLGHRSFWLTPSLAATKITLNSANYEHLEIIEHAGPTRPEPPPQGWAAPIDHIGGCYDPDNDVYVCFSGGFLYDLAPGGVQIPRDYYHFTIIDPVSWTVTKLYPTFTGQGNSKRPITTSSAGRCYGKLHYSRRLGGLVFTHSAAPGEPTAGANENKVYFVKRKVL
jgi:hypothetical protein